MAHRCNDLVITCMDHRVWRKAGQYLGIKPIDLLTAPGAAKALLNPAWQPVILEWITIAKGLHGVTFVHIIDHYHDAEGENCGAFGAAESIDDHIKSLRHAAHVLEQHFNDITPLLYIIHLTPEGRFKKIRPVTTK